MLMLKEGLVSGSPDEKEESARVLLDVIQLSSAKTLSSGKVVMAIAGPLIRVLGDRFSWNVKHAVLLALVVLIRKVVYKIYRLLDLTFLSGWISRKGIHPAAANFILEGAGGPEQACERAGSGRHQ